jgi:hypothetical protein
MILLPPHLAHPIHPPILPLHVPLLRFLKDDEENLVERLGSLKDSLEEFTQQAMDMMPEEVKERMFEKFQAYAASEILDFAPREGDICQMEILVDLRAQGDGPLIVTFFHFENDSSLPSLFQGPRRNRRGHFAPNHCKIQASRPRCWLWLK